MVTQYILILCIVICLFIFGYIKLMYPFWNNQPVYHSYDFIRQFYREPFVINQYQPGKTKYFDPIRVKTYNFRETDMAVKKQVTNAIQCFYLNTDKILHTIHQDDIQAILSGQSQPSFVSLYCENHYIQEFDASGSRITKNNLSLGTITSRHLHFWYVNKWKQKHHFVEMPMYMLDYLCVNRNKEQVNIYRKLLQTHEYNQRCINPSVSCSLIKKEIELFSGIVPFVQYKTYTFKLRNSRVQSLPKGYFIVELNKENMDKYVDFFYNNPDYCSKTELYDIMVFPDVGNITEMVERKLMKVFCLQGNNQVYGFYFFKDAKMYYEEIEGNTLHFVASVMNCLSPPVFYNGFTRCIQLILKKDESYQMLLFENLGHNTILLPLWTNNYSPIFDNKTAYYLYNMVFPGSPLTNKRVFILQ